MRPEPPYRPVVEVETALLWRRGAAGLIDLACVLAVVVTVAVLLVVTDPTLAIPPWNWFDRAVDYLHDRPGRASSIAVGLLFSLAAWPAVFGGRTPGRRILGLVFFDAEGLGPSRRRLLGWGVLSVAGLLLGGVGVTWALVDPERRTLPDRLARLWVAVTSDAPFRPRGPTGNRRLPPRMGLRARRGWW
jgi:uncharacterized RDD family membrane protein YckC